MVKTVCRWMAKRRQRQRKWRQSLHWYERWGLDAMAPEDSAEYAAVLLEAGERDKALEALSAALAKKPTPVAYERRARIYGESGKPDEAIADLGEAIGLAPESYLYRYARAIAYHERGDYASAEQDFIDALRLKDDDKGPTYFELGNVQSKLGKHEEALDSYRIATRDPKRAIPHFYYKEAQALEKLNRREEAVAVLAAGIRLQDQWRKFRDLGASALKERTNYSQTAVTSFIQGAQEEFGFRLYESRLLEQTGATEEALSSIDRALRAYPEAGELLLRRSALLRAAGKFAQAEDSLLRLLARNPLWLPVYMEMSTVYRLQGKHEETIATLLDAKRHFPANTIVRYWLIEAYNEGKLPQEARKESLLLTDMEADDPVNWRQRAELEIDADQFAAADESYTKAIAIDASAESYMRRSFARFMQDKFEEAMLDIQSAVAIDESLAQESRTAFACAELYAGMENWELADAEYSRALALEPDNSQIYERRARTRLSAGRLIDAIDDCNRGIQQGPSNPRLTALRAFIHFRLDEYDFALIDSRTYSELIPNDPQGHHNLGLVYNRLDRHDDAIVSFTKALELNPFSAQAYLERASLWYHHSFDRGRAADDLAQWLLYAGGERGEGDRFAMLNELRGFDDEMRERAKEQFLQAYGNGNGKHLN